MSLNKKPLRENGCLRTDNKILESYLFQYNGVSFFAAWHKGVFIPLNPAGSIIVDGIAEKMGKTKLDRIPSHLFKEVKEFYEIITDLNQRHGSDYCTYYVFDTLKKQRILELPKWEQKKITVKFRKPVYTKGEQILKDEISKKSREKIAAKHDKLIDCAIEAKKVAVQVDIKYNQLTPTGDRVFADNSQLLKLKQKFVE